MARRVGVVLSLVVMLTACSGYQMKRQAQVAEQLEQWDEAVLQYMRLVRDNPTNLEYRTALLRAKIQASVSHFETAKKYQDADLLQEALAELQEAVQLDPTNQYAQVERDKVRERLVAKRENRDVSGTIESMKDKTRGSLPQPPVLNPRSDVPIDVDFPEPVSVMDIYRSLGKAFGINVLFDPNLRDQRLSIELKQVTAREALEIVMRAVSHFYKVLNETTIIIAADTPQNRRTYEDQIIQTFFLSNSDVKDVMTMLRSLVESRQIAAIERLNAIVLRDTADKVKVAERLIESNDKARAEVVVDVELMQINSSRLREIGMSLEPRSLRFSLSSGTTDDDEESSGGNAVRVSDLEFLNQSNWFVTIPDFLIDFVKDTSGAQVLAKPQLRISEGEQASLVIGERVPIPVTSFNTGNTIGGNIVPVTSFQYQDVGITIDIEPRVHHNNEVTLKVQVEVSNLAGSVGNQPIIGTRNINTSIRLKDGETNFLAGLIRSDEITSEQGIPGISDIPVLGRLFSKKSNNNQRTDIVLTLTPHIVRRANITEEDLLPIWVGTATNFSFRGGSPRIESEVQGPLDGDVDPDAAAARRELRERLQQLPRGLRPEDRKTPDEQQQQEEQRPSGIDLVPSQAFPSRRSPFGSQPEETKPDEEQSRLDLDGDLPADMLPSLSAGGDVWSSPPEREPAVRLQMVAAGGEAALGATFDLQVLVEAQTPIAHVPMTFAYNQEGLELIEVVDGDFLGSSAQTEILSDGSQSGRVVVGASRLGRVPGVTGSGRLLTLRFRGKRRGLWQVAFSKAEALDSERQAVTPVAAEAVSVLVGPAPGPHERPEAGAVEEGPDSGR